MKQRLNTKLAIVGLNAFFKLGANIGSDGYHINNLLENRMLFLTACEKEKLITPNEAYSCTGETMLLRSLLENSLDRYLYTEIIKRSGMFSNFFLKF